MPTMTQLFITKNFFYLCKEPSFLKKSYNTLAPTYKEQYKRN